MLPWKGKADASIFGYRLPLDLSNFIDRMIYIGAYEPMNTFRFHRILRPGMLVVDAGAVVDVVDAVVLEVADARVS